MADGTFDAANSVDYGPVVRNYVGNMPTTPGLLGAVGRAAGRSALPLLGSLGGAAAAEAAGAPLIAGAGAATAPLGGIGAPIVAAGLGLAGAFGGGAATAKAQEAALNAMPDVRHTLGQDPEQIQADVEAHPIGTFLGELAPQAVALNPTNLLSKGLSASERVAAAGGAVIGGAIQGGQEAFNEYQADEGFDPLRIAGSAAAGAVFSGKSRFGLPGIMRGREGSPGETAPEAAPEDSGGFLKGPAVLTGPPSETPALPPPEPGLTPPPRQLALPAPTEAPPPGPPTLPGAGERPLQLTDQRGQVPIQQVGADPRLPPPPDFRAGPAGVEPTAEGGAPSVTPSADPVVEAARVQALQSQPAPISVTGIINRMRAETDGEIKGTENAYAMKIATAVADQLHGDGGAAGARDVLTKAADDLDTRDISSTTHDLRTQMLLSAHGVVDAHDATHQPPVTAPGSLRDRLAVAGGAEPAAPPPVPLTPRQETMQRLYPTPEAQAARRANMLADVISDPETRNPAGRFIAALRDGGFEPNITPEEAVRLDKHADAREAFGAMSNVRRVAGVAPTDVTAAEGFGVRDRPAEPAPAPEPPPPVDQAARQAARQAENQRVVEAAREARQREATPAPTPEPEAVPEAPRRGRGRPPNDEMALDRKSSGDLLQQVNQGVEAERAPPAGLERLKVAAAKRRQQASEPTDVSRGTSSEPGKAVVPEGVPTRAEVASPRERAMQMRDANQIGPADAAAIQRGLNNGAPYEALHDQLDSMAEEHAAPKARVGTTEGTAPAGAREQVKAQFRAELDRMGLHGVSVDVVDRVFDAAGEEVRGQYDPARQLIEVAMGAHAGEATDSLHHEVLHAMKTSGAFTPEQWRVLEDGAWGNKELRDQINKEYPDLSATARMEEAVAEMYSRARAGTWDTPKFGPLGRAMQGVQRFFEALGNTLRGRGFTTAEDVLGALGRGEIQAGDVRDANATVRSRVLDRDKVVNDSVTAGKDAVTNVYGKGLKGITNTLAVRQFRHWFPKLAEPLEGYWESNARAGVRKAERIADRSKVSDLYAKVKKAEMPEIARLREDAVERQHSPFAGATDVANRYKALSPEAQAALKEEHDAWREDMAEVIRITKDRIDRNTGMTPEAKAKAKDDVENRARKAVYFPSVRIGDLVGIATTPEYAKAHDAFETARQAHNEALDRGEDTTPHEAAMADAQAAKDLAYRNDGKDEYGFVRSHFENDADLQRFLKSMKEQGYDTRSTTATTEARADPGAAGSMLANAAAHSFDQAIAEATNEARTGKTPEERARAQGTIDSLRGQRDMMAQLYATLTPEGSRLRSNLMRKNVAGASTDIPRAFAIVARRNAGFLSALEYGSRAGDYLAQIKDVAEKTGDYRNMHAYDALKQHYDSLAKYSKTPIVNFLKSATYVYDLGLSPSFMAMHLAQTPLVTYPVLAARHGYGKSAAELIKAGGEVAASIKDWGGKGDLASLAKNDGESHMLHYLEKFGTIHGNEPGSLNDAASPTGVLGKGGKLIMNAAGFLPMKTELANRLTTALASYRMGLKDVNVQNALTDVQWKRAVDDGWKGSKQELAAARYAQEITLDTHIDYSRENMPNIMQGAGFKQLMFQFQKYQQGMIEQMARYTKDSFNKDLTPEERLVAMRTLAGVIMTHGLTTGAMGLPGFGLAAFGANLYHKFLSENKHEPWDAEVAFRKFATDHMGFDMGNALARGMFALPGVNQVLPGDVTDRLGMGDLLAPGTKVEGTDRSDLMQWLGSFAGGPAGSMLGNYAHAYTLAEEGRPERAAEQLAPKAIRDLMKVYRFAHEGVTTEKGAPVVKREDLTNMDMVAQALGFTPQHVEASQANRAALTEAQDEFKARKQTLTREYAMAAASQDQDRMSEVQDQIRNFNEARIRDREMSEILQPSALSQAIKQHALDNARLMEGVSLKPGDRSLLQEEGIY